MMVWKGEEIRTHGNMMSALLKLDNKLEAQEFMIRYRAVNPSADQNVGYAIGYFSPEDRERLFGILDGVVHPIFGRNF